MTFAYTDNPFNRLPLPPMLLSIIPIAALVFLCLCFLGATWNTIKPN